MTASFFRSALHMVALTFVIGHAATATAAGPVPEAPWRATVRAFALKTLTNPAWGYSHSERDYYLATQLAKDDGVRLDDDVTFAAAYLHDVAAFPAYAKEGVDHSDRGAEVIGSILGGSGFPEAKLEAVRAAIRTHMYYRDSQLAEARYLHDADALDWLGAIGVARVTALVDPAGGKPTGPDMVKMLQDNLAKVPSRVVTPAGRRMMPARRAFLERYLADLGAETANFTTL